jgi:hypothetical protein
MELESLRVAVGKGDHTASVFTQVHGGVLVQKNLKALNVEGERRRE